MSRMLGWLLIAAATIACAGWSAYRAPSVAADHVPGGYYAGQTASGMSVAFLVSADGTELIYGGSTLSPTCTISFGKLTSAGGQPIAASTTPHGFTAAAIDSGSRLDMTGTFGADGTVSGQITYAPGASPASGCPASGMTSSYVASRQTLSVTPNGPYAAGANSIVVEGAADARVVAVMVMDRSRLPVQAIWVFSGGSWRFYLPARSSIDGGLTRFSGPVTAAFAILQALNQWDASAVWNYIANLDLLRRECGANVSIAIEDPDQRACVETAMRSAGASDQAIAFLRANNAFLYSFAEQGRIDTGQINGGFNMGRPEPVFLNGALPVQDVATLIPAAWSDDPRYQPILANYPRAFVWPEYSELVEAGRTADGGQRFVFAHDLRECRACATAGRLRVAYVFDAGGGYAGSEILAPGSP